MELSQKVPIFAIGKLIKLIPKRITEGYNIMTRYNYFENICDDIRNWMTYEDIQVTHKNRHELAEELNDRLFCEDCITGNGSGSYTFSTWQAEENICHNWGLIEEVANEWGYTMDELMKKGAEGVDVCIRCYLLGSCIEHVIQEMLYN